MTCSKGYMGECGIRGGYAEVINMDPDVMAMLQKSISAKLCPTVIGQACMDVVVNPPTSGEPSFGSFDSEVKSTLASYAERAKLVADTLNSIEGITCNTVQGAMYAFPQIKFPEKALAAAAEAGQPADVFLRISTFGGNRNLHHPRIWIWSTTRHIPFQDYNIAAEGYDQ